jgi:hypothetical protein
MAVGQDSALNGPLYPDYSVLCPYSLYSSSHSASLSHQNWGCNSHMYSPSASFCSGACTSYPSKSLSANLSLIICSLSQGRKVWRHWNAGSSALLAEFDCKTFLKMISLHGTMRTLGSAWVLFFCGMYLLCWMQISCIELYFCSIQNYSSVLNYICAFGAPQGFPFLFCWYPLWGDFLLSLPFCSVLMLVSFINLKFNISGFHLVSKCLLLSIALACLSTPLTSSCNHTTDI